MKVYDYEPYTLLGFIWFPRLEYLPDSDIWSDVTPGGAAPRARVGHIAVWDTSSAAMLICCGQGDTGVYSAYTDMYDSRYNDLWSYSGGAWTELIESGSFTQRLDGAAVWDAATRSILGFGGQYWNVTNIYLDSIFLYSNSTNSWTEYTEVGPTARFDHALAWNPTARELYMFGGWMHSSLGDELWLLAGMNLGPRLGAYSFFGGFSS